jgi:hypothetical protein
MNFFTSHVAKKLQSNQTIASCKTKINSPVAFSHTKIEFYALCYVLIISDVEL